MQRFAIACCALLLAPMIGATSVRAEEFLAGTNSNSTLERLANLEAELAALRNANQVQETESNSNSFTNTYSSSGGFFGGAELTFLAPQAGTLSVSGQFNGNVLTPTQITPVYQSFVAGRFWTGYRNSEGLGFRVRYWDYSANAGGTLNFSNFTTRVNAFAADAEVTQVMQFGYYEMDFSMGMRFGKIGRSARFDEFINNNPLVLSQQFGGLGPTAAFFARRQLGQSNFSLIGGGRVSVLFGDNDYSANYDDGFFLGTITAQHATVMVYEMQAGVEWSRILASGSRAFARFQAEAQVYQVPSVAFGLLDNTTGLVGFSTAIGLDW